MKVLLDTHVWLWQLLEPHRLSRRAASVLEDDSTNLYLSPLSTWETLMLCERGRLALDPDPITWVREALGKSPLTVTELSHDVAVRSRQLAGFRSHDPVDRFLVATCLVGDLGLVTKDAAMRRYRPLRTIW